MSSFQQGNGAVRAVIFDLDGVIVDSHPIHKRCWQRFLQSCGKEVTEEELDFVLDGRKKEDILRHFLGEMPRDQVLEYGRRKETLFREEALSMTMLKGFAEFLEDVQNSGLPMAVASSGSRGRVHDILQQIGLHSRFRAIVTGDDVQRSKPDPTIFLVAAQRLGIECSSVLVVEDAVSGVVAAKHAGMKCLAIAGNNGRAKLLREAGADRVICDYVGLTMAGLQESLRQGDDLKRQAVVPQSSSSARRC